MPLSGELKLEVIKQYYGNDRSLTKTRRALMKIYPKELRNLNIKTIQRVVGKLETDLTLLPGRHTGRPKSAVIDKNVEKIKRSLEESPRRSVRDLSRRTKLSSTTVWRILRVELKKFAYKIQMKQQQTVDNKKQRLEFGEQFSAKVERSPTFVKNIVFTDEAHFHLNGHVNSQNARYWADENPNATIETPQTKEKVTVWLGIGYHGVFGPYFFEDQDGERETVKTTNYLQMLKKKFVPAIKRKNVLKKCWFQQDGAPPHCSNEAMEWLKGTFGSRLISRNADFLWPPYSPDLNPCDYYLWGFLKSRVYSDPVPQTTEQLKQNIRREVRRIKQTTVSSAVDNLLVRIQNLVFQKGSWFEQIINY